MPFKKTNTEAEYLSDFDAIRLTWTDPSTKEIIFENMISANQFAELTNKMYMARDAFLNSRPQVKAAQSSIEKLEQNLNELVNKLADLLEARSRELAEEKLKEKKSK